MFSKHIQYEMYFGVNCIQTFLFGEVTVNNNIIGYRVGNLVLLGHACSTVKSDFGQYI